MQCTDWKLEPLAIRIYWKLLESWSGRRKQMWIVKVWKIVKLCTMERQSRVLPCIPHLNCKVLKVSKHHWQCRYRRYRELGGSALVKLLGRMSIHANKCMQQDKWSSSYNSI